MKTWPAHVLLALLWLLHWLPLGLQAALGSALGRVLYTLARDAAAHRGAQRACCAYPS